MLQYSGNVDGAVPLLGTLKWMSELGWNVKEKWRPFFVNNQVGGYYEERDGMGLISIHGAGHMAP